MEVGEVSFTLHCVAVEAMASSPRVGGTQNRSARASNLKEQIRDQTQSAPFMGLCLTDLQRLIGPLFLLGGQMGLFRKGQRPESVVGTVLYLTVFKISVRWFH